MKDSMDKVITIPNVLSVIRLLLIPVIIWQYVLLKDYVLAAITVVISGATDVIDGFIARRFNMVSHVGRILDPAADKLTQIAVIGCLAYRFNLMILLLGVLALKELINGIIALNMLKKTKRTINSRWHGKAATVLLYATIVLHLFWIDIPSAATNISVFVCIAAMITSFALYASSNIGTIKRAGQFIENTEIGTGEKNESFDN